MNILLTFITLFISSVNLTIEDEPATLSIFREGKFTGVVVNYNIWIDGKEVCTLSNDKYINLKLDAGQHIIMSKAGGIGYASNPKTFLKVNIESGKSYFIKATARMKGISGILELKEINNDDAEIIKSKIKKFDNCQTKISTNFK
jgi:hypothetical protein